MAINDPEKMLNHLLKEKGEKAWIEFKENNFNPDYIGQWISACGNAAILAHKQKAFLVFGIQDKTLNKIGTTNKLADVKVGNENFSNWISRMVQPSLMLDFVDFESDGKAFSILMIEPTYDRPVQFKETEYIRIGENVKKLKDFPNHERSIWLATGQRRFENAIALSHQSVEQVKEKLHIETYYEMTDQPQPGSDSEIMRRFVDCGFLVEDMEGGYDITNLSAILFAKDLAFFPTIATKSVRVIKYTGRDKSESSNEIEGKKGYVVGFTNLLEYVEKNTPHEEKYVTGIRKKAPIYPSIAIREVIANALIHQDFLISGSGPVIEIYSDRIEVINPGNSLISIDRMIDERRSRNEKLASTARALGMCEERGGGLDKALIAIENRNLPAFELIASENSMRVILFGPKVFFQLTKGEKQRACFWHCVLKWVIRDLMSNASLRARFSLEPDDYQAVSALISEMIKSGRIVPAEKNQGNRYAKYIPYFAGD